MTNKLRLSFGFIAILAIAALGVIFAATAVRAEDNTGETAREAEKKALEARLEAEKKAAETAREIEKDFAELDRELNKELGDDMDDDEDEAKWENADEEALEHRSEVANFVLSLLKIASSTSKGLGDEVRKVAKEQNAERDRTAEAMDKVKSRNALVTLLIGADYKNLGELRSSIVTTENHIKQLENIKKKTSGDVAALLDAEIKSLATEKDRLAKIVEENEDKVSLFGWLVKLLQ